MGPYLYRVEGAIEGADWLKFSNAPQTPPPEDQLRNEIQKVIAHFSWMFQVDWNNTATSDRYYAATSESLMWAFYHCHEMRNGSEWYKRGWKGRCWIHIIEDGAEYRRNAVELTTQEVIRSYQQLGDSKSWSDRTHNIFSAARQVLY
jgi:hypothetical protein